MPLCADALALCGVEAAVAHEATYPSRAAEYGPVLAGLLETGRALDGLAVAKIWHRREAFRGQLNALFRDIDLLIIPAMDRAAPTLGLTSLAVLRPQLRRASASPRRLI